MNAAILKCKAGSQFHFGKYAPDSDTALSDTTDHVHSDTLFSALVNTYNEIFPESTDEFVSCFERGEITVSSCFFCLEQSGKTVWFLPKPAFFDLIEVEDFKSFRKIRYISKKLWENITSPAELVDQTKVVVVQNIFALYRDELTLSHDSSWEYIRFFNSLTLPKVQVRKLKQEDNLYQLSTLEIAENSLYAKDLNIHYYFLYQLSDTLERQMSERFSITLDLLGLNGIGAERSTIGKLEGIELLSNWELDLEKAGDNVCSISLVSPTDEEVKDLLYYRTVFRGGRKIGLNQLQLKSLRMLAEGAVVKPAVKGLVHSISPDKSPHLKFKRNGRAFTIPLKQSWSHE